ncbi:phosphoribosylformylglycinamidine synthase subunit PurQ [Siminovitchia terrae]|uniref:Phosphoribosylformylglycinamidine synthase subunit PurQ n=1 Tax=Siminovitchia terrae TaxID=1914933 RepID=A0ABQ4L017_SIMTE|nr:phosphoribosylformylglycinamidine synthase subunit PurQ [Siminovitchia terrae]GIN92945.1 phosphoribosylformylglycinamidine synthase subunit PurQ [Siminovitchia terrae]GIN97550.1 phosphoribosylformylglycinamidine synthase subunit PurQ [Siminovitchia terrae]
MKIAIVVFPGTTCESDLYEAVRQTTGEEAEYVRHDVASLEGYDAVLIPGGASYGDAIRPGAIAKRQPVMKEIIKAAEAGKPVLGIGNGFQILLEAGLLPGTLLTNERLKFVCKPVKLQVANNDSTFTSLYKNGETISLPVAHKKGCFYCSETELKKLRDNNQIIFTYTSENPNGSMADIAGIANEKGNVLGLMPHPERAVDELLGSAAGVKLFKSIVQNWRETNVTNA